MQGTKPKSNLLFFIDTREEQSFRERLKLVACALQAPLVYLCLFPSQEKNCKEIVYSRADTFGPDTLEGLGNQLLGEKLEAFIQVPDPAEHPLTTGLDGTIKKAGLLAIHPLEQLDEPGGYLVALDTRKRELSEAERDAFSLCARDIQQQLQDIRTPYPGKMLFPQLKEVEKQGKLGYWEWDKETDELTWSGGTYALHGQEPEAFNPVLEKIGELVHPGDRERFWQFVKDLKEGSPKRLDTQYRVVKPDGSIAWLHQTGHLVKDSNGNSQAKGSLHDVTGEQASKRSLEEYTAFMENTLHNMPIGVCLFQVPDMQMRFGNDTFFRIIGWPGSETHDGYTLLEKLYPDSKERQKRMEDLEKHLRDPGIEAKLWEAREITTASGDTKVVNTRYVVLREQRLVLLILSDVTEIHKTKEELSFMNERYRLSTLATSDVIWDSDLLREEHYWGENYSTLFGYPEQKDLSRNFHDWEKYVHPEDLPGTLASLRVALASHRSTWKAEYRYKHGATGEYRHVLDQGYIIRDETGRAIRMVGAMKDITERLENEGQLRLFASAIENTRDGILITEAEIGAGPDGQVIRYANAAFLQMTQYSKEELLGKSPEILRGPKTDYKSLNYLNRQVAMMQPGKLDLLNYKRNGDEFWVNISVTPVLHEETNKIHYIAVQREINLPKAKELNRQLINRLSRDLSRQLNYEKTVSILTRSIGELLEAAVVECWVMKEFEQEMYMAGFYATEKKYECFREDTAPEKDAKTEGLVGRIRKSGKPYAHRDITAENSPLHRKEKAGKAGLRAAYGIPLFSGTELVGALVVFYPKSTRDFARIMAKRLEDCDRFLGAELKRKQLNEQLGRLMDSVPDMIVTVGKDGYFKKVNPGTSKILGYTANELLEIPLTKLVRPEDRFSSDREFLRLVRGGEPRYFEHRMQTAAGATRWIAWTPGKPNDEGYFQAVGKDITEIRQKITEIKTSNHRFQLVSEITHDAIWEWRTEQEELIWTEGFERLFGYAPGSYYEEGHWREKVHPEDLEEVVEKYQRVMADTQRESLLAEYRFRRADGTYAEVLDHARVVRNADGSVRSLVGAIQDITQRKRHERELTELNRELKYRNEQLVNSNTELEHFAYMASHDLQEPLRMITGFLTQLEKRYGELLDEKGRTYIHYAVDGARRMRNLIRELLEYSRIGRSHEQLEDVSVPAVLDEVEVIYRMLLEQTGGKIIRQPGLPTIRSFRVLVFQLFQNLIDNALKYRRPDVAPEIHIGFEERENAWEFFVSDNGIGIDPAYHEKIFIIFQRLHQKEEYSGTGMGLTTAKKIVESLGGRIEVQSEVNQGTRFTFTLLKDSGEI